MKANAATTGHKAMFTIDLLNGQAIPPKGKPGGLAILAVTAIVPIAVTMAMFVTYLNNKVTLSVKQKEIARYEAEVDKLADAVKTQRALEQEKQAYGKYLSEVKSSISRHTQWSSVLATLIENLPDSVVLTSLAIQHESVRKSVPKKDNPKKKVEISVPVRILRLGVSAGDQRNCDQAVREFMDRLWAAASLGPRLETIGHSQQSVKAEGQNIMSYQISCFFKPGL